TLLEGLEQVLRFFHGITAPLPVLGAASWGWAIILLTIAVRLVLLPLAVKQTNSMRAMQHLQPEIKKLQAKHKVDRGLMRSNPEKYKEARQKQQEAVMALYKEHNVNPASSCLPLVAQMPIFIALFSMLRSPDIIPELVKAPFPIDATLQMPANQAGIIAIGMLLAMGVTTFVQQKQMMGRQAVAADDQQMQQQKMMLYIMPVFLVFLGFNLPVGVLVYWVTTNLLQMAQQWYMLREVDHEASGGGRSTSSGSGSTRGTKRSGGSKPTTRRPTTGKPPTSKGKGGTGRSGSQGNGHKPGGPGRLGRKNDETRDKRR
ncbi:MAG TPA: YidC/Oxa1 family membrane protein insertase, partial [Euzebyales bacterium]|nr:YidC/Oxa1 family membrane protein insertase [Euzebyales bacterium]